MRQQDNIIWGRLLYAYPSQKLGPLKSAAMNTFNNGKELDYRNNDLL